jgi:glycosyltransferase involved in cell wall biosynthesis
VNDDDGRRDRPKVAFVFTHQIQYFGNLLRELHRRRVIQVLAVYAQRTATMRDPGFGRFIEWDNESGESFPSIALGNSERASPVGFFSSFRWRLFTLLDEFDPDAVHLNGYAAAIQWQAWAWAILHRKQIFIRGDGDTFSEAKLTMRRMLAHLFTRLAEHVFHQGSENKKFWLLRGARQAALSWIPCVPDNLVFRSPAFADLQAREQFRRMIGSGAGETVFVVSGKLERRKRPQDALYAMARLQQTSSRLWFLGSGDMQQELHDIAERLGVTDRIFWWGFRNQSEMPRILQAADVLLHLSEFDPWPYSVLEGAMSGLALLVSDRTGSVPDLIDRASGGLKFACGDIEDLAEKMKLMATDGVARAKFRDAAIHESQRHSEAAFCEVFESAVIRVCSVSR